VRRAPAVHVIARAQIVSGDAHAALEHDDRVALPEGELAPHVIVAHHRVVREQSFITTMTFKELSMTSKVEGDPKEIAIKKDTDDLQSADRRKGHSFRD